MKKISFILFIFIFIFIIDKNIYAKEEYKTNLELNNYNNLDSISPYISNVSNFNYIEVSNGLHAKEVLNYNNELIKELDIEGDVITITYGIDIYERLEYRVVIAKLYLRYYISDYKINKVELYLDTIKLIVFNINENNEYEYETPSYYYIMDFNSYFYKLNITSINYSSENNISGIDDISPDLFYLIFYTEDNPTIIEYIDINNPLSLDLLLEDYKIYDINNDLINNYKIIETNYDINNLITKQYNADIRIITNDYKIYDLNLVLDVKDIDNGIRLKNYKLSYKNKISEEDIINQLEVNAGYKNIYIKSNYFYNSIPNIYDYYVYVEYNDYIYYKRGIIEVYDDITPVLYSNNIIQLVLGSSLSLEELKNKVWVYDEIDGTIKNDDIKIFGYENINFNKEGKYNIALLSYDSYFNYLYENIIIEIINNNKIINQKELMLHKEEEIKEEEIIEEKEEEVLDNDDYVIYAYTSKKISISEVYDLLLAEKLISEDSIIESDYFDTEPKAGIYELKVIESDNSCKYFSIIVQDKEKTFDNENNSFNWVIVLSVILGITFVGIIIGFGVYIHGKKN